MMYCTTQGTVHFKVLYKSGCCTGEVIVQVARFCTNENIVQMEILYK